VLLLIAATLVSFALRDTVDALIILGIVFASGVLGFVQERGAVRAVQALLNRVQVSCEALRDGTLVRIAHDRIVPGDVIRLSAGDIVPADSRVITSNALRVDESVLTGEPFPVEKSAGQVPATAPLTARANVLYSGTHLVSGDGFAVAVQVGTSTALGAISSHLRQQHVPTSFERGVTAFGYLLVRATAVLVVGILIVNLALGRSILDAVLFSLALAVGLTPQMLPAIVTLSLSIGARVMAREQVIVKRLDAIEDIGEIDILCTDKTGTITSGVITLEATLNVDGQPDAAVGMLAWVNASCQQGFANAMDMAILQRPLAEPIAGLPTAAIAELPYDFSRRMLTVLVDLPEGRSLVTKGAFASILATCTTVAVPEGGIVPLETRRASLNEQVESLSARGYRVLGVAHRAAKDLSSVKPEDEAEMTFDGFLAFADPPKPGAADAIRAFSQQGISVCMVTGDNRFAAIHLAESVGLATGAPMTGSEIARLSDDELAGAVHGIAVFAEIDPLQKERIVRAFRKAGHAVGFLGDGINDAPALHVADVGISVDTAADVAKQTADLVLLQKDLAILESGIREGRRVFANTMKYVFVTTSANFGNMLSMAAAAAFLPFLPLLPRQILLLNFMSDIPGMTIAADNVDPEQVSQPRRWDVAKVRSFMLIFGVISSAFDILTFVILLEVLDASTATFRTAWFIESTLTELAVMLVLRTPRPFFRSLPATPLLVASVIVAGTTLVLPFTGLAGVLGMRSLALTTLAALAAITAAYVIATEVTKHRFQRLMH